MRPRLLAAMAAALAILVLTSTSIDSAGTRRRARSTAEPARPAAPIDVTGYWVAYITEDWRWRMVTPAKGDYASIPLNVDGKRAADAWDPGEG